MKTLGFLRKLIGVNEPQFMPHSSQTLPEVNGLCLHLLKAFTFEQL